jgi:hypothetical protein
MSLRPLVLVSFDIGSRNFAYYVEEIPAVLVHDWIAASPTLSRLLARPASVPASAPPPPPLTQSLGGRHFSTSTSTAAPRLPPAHAAAASAAFASAVAATTPTPTTSTKSAYAERLSHANVVSSMWCDLKRIRAICSSGTTRKLGVVDLVEAAGLVLSEKTARSVYAPALRQSLLGWLRSCAAPELAQAAALVVEQQMSTAIGTNVRALKMSESVLTYAALEFPETAPILLPSRYKSDILQAPDGLKHTQLKKWSVNVAESIVSVRGDTVAQNAFAEARARQCKLDDMADAFMQCQAFKVRLFASEDRKLAPPSAEFIAMLSNWLRLSPRPS